MADRMHDLFGGTPNRARRKASRSKGFRNADCFLIVGVATALSGPIALELTGGSVKGDLVSWNGQQAVVKAEFGSLTFKREQLSQATLQRLDLLSGNPQNLGSHRRAEGTVERLRTDNDELRQRFRPPASSHRFNGAAFL